MFHIGASDAPNWAKAVCTMTERAKELGPNPIRKTYLKDLIAPRPLTVDETTQEISTELDHGRS